MPLQNALSALVLRATRTTPALIAGLILPIFMSMPAYAVVVDGLEWMAPGQVKGFSWNTVATVCPAGGGTCSGSLGATNLTGWNWATVQEVGALFHALTPHPGGIARYNEVGSTWAPNFLYLKVGTTGFDNIIFNPAFFAQAWSATSFSDTEA